MTKLIVKPIDMAEPGSYRLRQRLLRAFKTIRDARERNDNDAVLDSFAAVEDLIIPRLTTDNGVSVQEALDQVSANDFDQLFSGLLQIEAVPPVSASNSSLPSVAP